MEIANGFVLKDLKEQVRQLERQVAGYAATRTGRLVALTISVPPGCPWSGELLGLLDRRLAEDGAAGVTLQTVEADGPPRMVAAEFER